MSSGVTSGADSATVGVEEEFLLFDTERGEMADRNVEVAAAADRCGLDTQLELTACQIETATSPVTTREQLAAELTRNRHLLAAAAGDCGLRPVAAGISPLVSTSASITATSRYREIGDQFGRLAKELSMCGCHVHVAIPDRDTAVQVSNYLRPWLPTLLALTANSPIHQSVDTGHASWRAIEWSRWPAAGVPPHFRSTEHYDTVIDMLMNTGVILDPAMAYWDIRPATGVPTIEIRISDVPATTAETVTLACVVRALVQTACRYLEQGRTAAPVDDNALGAARWKAAHDGIAGSALDLTIASPALVPAAHMVHLLLRYISPALDDYGELSTITRALHHIVSRGNGATRQQALFAAGGVGPVMKYLCDITYA